MLPEKLVVDIIKEQSLIIGEPLARSRAEITGSIIFKSDKIDEITIPGSNPSLTIDKLIKSYEEVFGQASVEVCVSVFKRYPKNDIQNFLPDRIKLVV
ncbi:hypothetical protein HYV31_01920 [candidate division WWE3 bacterium]|nr:hypothetical protein [candidate division WWE3 bacterium]